MFTNIKIYPPRIVVEDYALDVATVCTMKALDNNIARYAGGHGQSSYPVSSTGVVGVNYAGSSVDIEMVGVLCFNQYVPSGVGYVNFLLGASVANKSTFYVCFCEEATNFNYPYNSARARIKIQLHEFQRFGLSVTSTNILWYSIPFENAPERVTAFLMTKGDGATAVATTLYASQVNVEDIYE